KPLTDGVWVVVPAHNEGPAIADTLDRLLPWAANVVVVDDGSSDDTADTVAKFPVWLVRHVINRGQGAALKTGIDFALSRGAAAGDAGPDSARQRKPRRGRRPRAALRRGPGHDPLHRGHAGEGPKLVGLGADRLATAAREGGAMTGFQILSLLVLGGLLVRDG